MYNHTTFSAHCICVVCRNMARAFHILKQQQQFLQAFLQQIHQSRFNIELKNFDQVVYFYPQYVFNFGFGCLLHTCLVDCLGKALQEVQRGFFKKTFLLLHSAEKERENREERVILILSDKKKSSFLLHKMSQYSSCMYLNTSVRDFLCSMYAHHLQYTRIQVALVA